MFTRAQFAFTKNLVDSYGLIQGLKIYLYSTSGYRGMGMREIACGGKL